MEIRREGKDDLLRRWVAVIGGPEGWNEVVAAYGQPHRRYHTAEHLGEVFAALDAVAPTRPPAVDLAALLHDAVYEPRAAPGASEEASAALAERLLPGLGVSSG
jgi:predicted metal-dependent HD superfamily phosphohydrolase